MKKTYNLMISGEIGINGTSIPQRRLVNTLNNYKKQVYDLKWAILMAQVGSCTCLTKTNESENHDEHCKYRILDEALQKTYEN